MADGLLLFLLAHISGQPWKVELAFGQSAPFCSLSGEYSPTPTRPRRTVGRGRRAGRPLGVTRTPRFM